MDKKAKNYFLAEKKQRFYSVMIVPHDAGGRPLSLKIPASLVYLTASILAFSLLFAGSSFVYSTIVSRRLIHYADTLSKNKEQTEVIKSFSLKTNKVEKELSELAEKDNELRRILGLKTWDKKIRLSFGKKKTEVRPATSLKLQKAEKVSFDLNQVDSRLAERRKSFEELKTWVSFVQSRFAQTPSTWPIYGRLVSFFGYRSYPWRGFHSGIDIQAAYGAPARATAAGVVTYIGWRNGYGKTVEISHGYGVATVYAHNSNYAVSVGQRVKRGQVVSYVGTTGWTTGPHLHYEVRRYDRPYNPMAYLNLNILSASRLWK